MKKYNILVIVREIPVKCAKQNSRISDIDLYFNYI